MPFELGERAGGVTRIRDGDGQARQKSRSFAVTHFFDEWFVQSHFSPLLRFCCKWHIHPNVITAFSLGLSAALLFFHLSRWTWAVIAAILLRQFLDCLDGEVARRCRKTSRLGAWLDNISDTVFYLALISIVVSFFARSLLYIIGWSCLIFGGLFVNHVIAFGGGAIIEHAVKDYDTRSVYRRAYAFMVNDSLVFAAAAALLYGLLAK